MFCTLYIHHYSLDNKANRMTTLTELLQVDMVCDKLRCTYNCMCSECAAVTTPSYVGKYTISLAAAHDCDYNIHQHM